MIRKLAAAGAPPSVAPAPAVRALPRAFSTVGPALHRLPLAPRHALLPGGRRAARPLRAVDGQVALPSNALAGIAQPRGDLAARGRADGASGAPDAHTDANGSPDGASNGSLDWDRWLEHFQATDALTAARAELAAELAAAVREERYSAAADAKKRLAEVEAQDAVQGVLKALDDALANERYSEAARLRDGALTGLQGWWCGSSEGDPQGHLLHVTAEFGRWTGRVYTPRDLADLKGWSDDYGPQLRAQGGDREPAALDEVGTPLLEVFMRPGEDGSLQRQAVLLKPPSEEEAVLMEPMDDGPGRSPSAGGSGGVTQRSLRLSVSVGDDGITDVTAVSSDGEGGEGAERGPLRASIGRDGGAGGEAGPLGGAPPSVAFSGAWQNGEVRQALAALKSEFLNGGAGSGSGSGAASLGGSAAPGVSSSFGSLGAAAGTSPASQGLGALDAVFADAKEALRSAGDALSSALQPDSAAPGTASASAAGAANNIASTSTNAGTSVDGAASSSGAGGSEFGRIETFRVRLTSSGAVAASVTRAGSPPPDFEILESPSNPSSSRYGADAPSALYAGVDSTGGDADDGDDDFMDVGESTDEEEDESEYEEDLIELSRVPADVVMEGRDRFTFTVRKDCTSDASTSGRDEPGGSPAGLSPRGPRAGSRRIELEVNLPGAAGKSPAGSADGNGAAGDDAETWRKVAEEVARIQELRGGRSVPRQKLADAIARMAGKLIPSGAAAGGEPRVVRLAEVRGTPAAPPGGALGTLNGPLGTLGGGRVSYSRIEPPACKTDAFSGLYLGAFGPHGPELLRLQRGRSEDGEELVIGTKLTGDANVPAGAVSFRARIGRKRRLEPRDVYPDDLGVVARYAGEGRVAQPGFKNARWVDGELLQFGAAGTLLTGGAELGFVWAVPGEKRFLILLNRIDLE